jgi:hypothetical protein
MTTQQEIHNGAEKTIRQAQDGVAASVNAAETALKNASADVADQSKAALSGMLAGSREWLDWARDAYQANMRAWQALVACRTAQTTLSIQQTLMQEQFKLFAENSRRMSMATWKTALSANEHPRRPA